MNILVIDDKIEEFEIISRITRAISDTPIYVDHAFKCSEAVTLMGSNPYDLILLDNRLSRTVSAEFSVPFLRSTRSKATIVIMSNDITPTYLEEPGILGVDHVIDKMKVVGFLRNYLAEAAIDPALDTSRNAS